MTKDNAIKKLETTPTVETLWSIVANQINIGQYDDWYKEVYDIATIIEKNNKKFTILSIQSLDMKDIDVKQYFVFVSNGGKEKTDFVEDVLNPVRDFFQILKESGVSWVNVCDYMADTIDDTYTWVLTFTVKNIDKN